MAARITYRLFQDGDLAELMRLWAEETDWGSITAEEWSAWFRYSPFGESIIMVAIDQSGVVVGQIMVVLHDVVIDGKRIRAARLIAPILRSDHRMSSMLTLKHPIVEMTKSLVEVAASEGIELIFAIPEYNWFKWFRFMGRFGLPAFPTAEFAHYRISVEEARASLSERPLRTAASSADTFGNDFMTLWNEARQELPLSCCTVRTPAWLDFMSERLRILAVRDKQTGSLVGYSSLHLTKCTLMDILARSREDFTEVLGATLFWLINEYEATPESGLNHLNVLDTPLLHPALDDLRFSREKDKYAFAYKSLNSAIPDEAIAPGRWFLALGD